MDKPIRKPWDKRMRRLFREAPQDFVKWLLSEATLNGIIP
jgi:hypothetical protein